MQGTLYERQGAGPWHAGTSKRPQEVRVPGVVRAGQVAVHCGYELPADGHAVLWQETVKL